MIDKSAVIHPSAKIADDAIIGPNVVIGENVTIGSKTRVIANAYIEFAEIGDFLYQPVPRHLPRRLHNRRPHNRK